MHVTIISLYSCLRGWEHLDIFFMFTVFTCINYVNFCNLNVTICTAVIDIGNITSSSSSLKRFFYVSYLPSVNCINYFG